MRDKAIVNCRYFRTRKITSKDTLINIKMNILIYEKFNNINYKEMSFSLYKESQWLINVNYYLYNYIFLLFSFINKSNSESGLEVNFPINISLKLSITLSLHLSIISGVRQL